MNSTNKKTRPPTTGARILVLEDDEAVGRVIFRRLEAAGHRVRVFAQAAPALDEIDRGASFDLYLLDVQMPAGELHGLALARMIKIRHPNPRIIFTTGDPHLVSALDRQIGPVFAKPIDFVELLKEIERQLAAGS
jgi:DNA-binding NtrC family response regulator